MYELLLPVGIKRFRPEENPRKIPGKKFILNNLAGSGCVILLEIELVYVDFSRDFSNY